MMGLAAVSVSDFDHENDNNPIKNFDTTIDNEFIHAEAEQSQQQQRHQPQQQQQAKQTPPKCDLCGCSACFMLKGVDEGGDDCHACLDCVFHKLMDQSLGKFMGNNKDFESKFFSYRDKFKS